MASSGAPASSPRQMPVNVTTAPISLRPRRSFSVSLAASNGSRCSRTVAAMSVSRSSSRLSTRHRRKEGDLARTRNGCVGANVGAINGSADYPRVFERVGVFLAALAQPSHEFRDRCDARRWVDLLLGLADALANPGEITKLQR